MDFEKQTKCEQSSKQERDDWATLPFNEAEDAIRWTRLLDETDKLIDQAESNESILKETPAKSA